MMKRICIFFLLVNILYAAAPPSNDDREDSMLIGEFPFRMLENLRCATTEEGEVEISSPLADRLNAGSEVHTVWWEFTAPAGSPQVLVVEFDRTMISSPFLFGLELFQERGDLELAGTRLPVSSGSLILEPGAEYLVRGVLGDFFDGTPSTVFHVNGNLASLASNVDSNAPLAIEDGVIPAQYAPLGETLYWEWTSDESGLLRIPETSIQNASYEISSLGQDDPLMQNRVEEGVSYLISLTLPNVTDTSDSVLLSEGEFEVFPENTNQTEETATPLLSFGAADARSMELIAASDDAGRSFWWSWTPTQNGQLLLKEITNSSGALVRLVKEDGELVLLNPFEPISLEANVDYFLWLEAGTTFPFFNQPKIRAIYYPQGADAMVQDEFVAGEIRRTLGLPSNFEISTGILTRLTELELAAVGVCNDDCNFSEGEVQTLEGLSAAKNLETLYLRGGSRDGHSLISLEPIRDLVRLKRLRLPNSLAGTDEEKQAMITEIGNLTRLKRLSLEQNGLKSEWLTPLSQLSNLTRLDLDDNEITDITMLKDLRHLTELDIDKNPIVDFAPLGGMQKLHSLDLTMSGYEGITLPALRRLQSVRGNFYDLSPLARCQNLSGLRLAVIRNDGADQISNISDLTPLANLENLYFLIRSGIKNTVQSVLPLTFGLETEDQRQRARNLIQNIAPGSLLSAEDPETRRIFTELNIDLSLLDRPELSPSLQSLKRLAQRDLGFVRDLVHLRSLVVTDGLVTDVSLLADLPDITSIDLRNNFISDVTPLAGLAGVSIDLRGNPIDYETVPASWLNDPLIQIDPEPELQEGALIPDLRLKGLVCSALGLPSSTELSVADLAELRILHADYAEIRSLSGLEHATQLEGISLRNNVIKDLSPLTSDQLRWIRVSGNRLNPASLGLLETMAMNGVSVDRNETNRFQAALAASDDVVYLDNYQLSSLRFLGLFPEVRTLYLADNFLENIDELGALEHLEHVDLRGNFIPADSAIVAGLRARGVTVLTGQQRPELNYTIQASQLELKRATADALGLPYLPPAFSTEQLESITRFDWERSVPEGSHLEDPDFISQMTALTFLSLERSGLNRVDFLENLTELTRLDLDFNELTDISSLAGLVKMRELDLNDNQLTNLIALSDMVLLEELDIDRNFITNLEGIGGLVNLIELDAELNQLTSVTELESLRELTFLLLHRNEIEDFSPLQSLVNLNFLRIEFNGTDWQSASQREVFRNLQASAFEAILHPQFVPELTISRKGDELTIEWVGEPRTSYFINRSTGVNSFFGPRVGERPNLSDDIEIMSFRDVVDSAILKQFWYVEAFPLR